MTWYQRLRSIVRSESGACGVEPHPHRDTGQTDAIRPGIHAQTPPTFDRAHVMTIHFIGAGPGAADLITVRGRDLIAACPVCLYAGSLVPPALLTHCPPGARIVDTAPLSLDQIVAECARAARRRSGRGASALRRPVGMERLGEQLRRLDDLGIAVHVTPGVPSFAAAAAALGRN